MTKHILMNGISIAFALVLAGPPALAQSTSSDLVPFRGRLQHDGVAYANPVTLTFRLYPDDNDATAPFYEESKPGITPAPDGQFAVFLGEAGHVPGSAAPLALRAELQRHPSVWIGVEVDGVKLNGRQRLGAAPFSVQVPDESIAARHLAGFKSCGAGQVPVRAADGTFTCGNQPMRSQIWDAEANISSGQLNAHKETFMIPYNDHSACFLVMTESYHLTNGGSCSITMTNKDPNDPTSYYWYLSAFAWNTTSSSGTQDCEAICLTW